MEQSHVCEHTASSSHLGTTRTPKGVEFAHPFVPPPHVMLRKKGPTRCTKTQVRVPRNSSWQVATDMHTGQRPLEPHRNRYLLGPEALSLQAFWTPSPRDNLCLIFFPFTPVHPEEGRNLALLSVHLIPQASPLDRLTAC